MTISPRITRQPNYRDLDLNFDAHPTTGDISRLEGFDAVKRSIRNLVLMNFYDKKFQSHIASGAQKLLFDNATPLAEAFLRNAIIEVITNFEPRAALFEDENHGVKVSFDFDNNGYNVQIKFIEVNRGEPVLLNLFLTRIR